MIFNNIFAQRQALFILLRLLQCTPKFLLTSRTRHLFQMAFLAAQGQSQLSTETLSIEASEQTASNGQEQQQQQTLPRSLEIPYDVFSS